MVFDPATIKRRPIAGDEREGKVLGLANMLLERGLASSLGAAKRLAEGMVETERKVIVQGSPRAESREDVREKAQQDPLFRAVGVKAERRLAYAEPFRRFVEKAKVAYEEMPKPAVQEVAKPVEALRPEARQVLYDEAPAERREPVADAWPLGGGYVKTQVETTPDSVVVRHVVATPTTDAVLEEGVVRMDAPQEKKPADDLAKVDLFDFFKKK